MCGYESVGLLALLAEHGNIILQECKAKQPLQDSHTNMSGTDKNKLSTQAERPAPVADSSKQEKAGAADRGKHTGAPMAVEIGGRKGLEPTRFGDWEKNGRCTDF